MICVYSNGISCTGSSISSTAFRIVAINFARYVLNSVVCTSGFDLKYFPTLFSVLVKVAFQSYFDSRTVCAETTWFYAHTIGFCLSLLSILSTHRSSCEVRVQFVRVFFHRCISPRCMHVLQDVHEAKNDQQTAVACSIASSHEDLHEKTSISSCADLNSQSVVPITVSQRMDPCLEFLITNHGSFSSVSSSNN